MTTKNEVGLTRILLQVPNWNLTYKETSKNRFSFYLKELNEKDKFTTRCISPNNILEYSQLDELKNEIVKLKVKKEVDITNLETKFLTLLSTIKNNEEENLDIKSDPFLQQLWIDSNLKFSEDSFDEFDNVKEESKKEVNDVDSLTKIKDNLFRLVTTLENERDSMYDSILTECEIDSRFEHSRYARLHIPLDRINRNFRFFRDTEYINSMINSIEINVQDELRTNLLFAWFKYHKSEYLKWDDFIISIKTLNPISEILLKADELTSRISDEYSKITDIKTLKIDKELEDETDLIKTIKKIQDIKKNDLSWFIRNCKDMISTVKFMIEREMSIIHKKLFNWLDIEVIKVITEIKEGYEFIDREFLQKKYILIKDHNEELQNKVCDVLVDHLYNSIVKNPKKELTLVQKIEWIFEEKNNYKALRSYIDEELEERIMKKFLKIVNTLPYDISRAISIYSKGGSVSNTFEKWFSIWEIWFSSKWWYYHYIVPSNRIKWTLLESLMFSVLNSDKNWKEILYENLLGKASIWIVDTTDSFDWLLEKYIQEHNQSLPEYRELAKNIKEFIELIKNPELFSKTIGDSIQEDINNGCEKLLKAILIKSNILNAQGWNISIS